MSIVFHNVPMIPQNTQNTCWWAAARMVVQYHRESRQQTTIAGGVIGQAEANAFIDNNDRVLDPAKAEDLARLANMRTTSLSPTPEGLVGLLIMYGPLWYGGVVEGYRGFHNAKHAVVITGCSTLGSVPTVNINDPWEIGIGAKLTETFNDFFSNLRAMTPMLHI